MSKHTTTCVVNGLTFDVGFDYEPAIFGGLEEEPQPEELEITSVKYEGASFFELLNEDAFKSMERQIRESKGGEL